MRFVLIYMFCLVKPTHYSCYNVNMLLLGQVHLHNRSLSVTSVDRVLDLKHMSMYLYNRLYVIDTL